MLLIFFSSIFLKQVLCIPVLNNFTSKIINAGEIIELHFNQNLNLSLNYNKCENLFDANTTSKLGSQPLCRVISENIINLFPSQDANLTAMDSLVFDNATIAANVSFLINGTEAFALPIVKITGPISKCSCPQEFQDDLKVNVDLSNLTGYAPLKDISWHIYDDKYATTDNGTELFVDKLQPFQGLSEITIQSNWFDMLKMYYINVIGKNAFGNIGTGKKEFGFLDNCLPYAEVLVNSMHSDDDSIALKAKVTYPSCTKQERIVSPDWFVLGQDFDKSVDTFSDLLYIPVSTLIAGNYEVILRYTVRDKYNEDQKLSEQISLQIASLNPNVKIVGGNRTVGKTDILNLYTELSSKKTATYKWKCLDNKSPCVQSGKDIVFPANNYLQLELLPTDLLSSLQYTFQVSSTYNGYTSLSSVEILVLDNDVPKIKIRAKKPKVSSFDVITFTADVENIQVEIVYSWSCSYKFDGSNEELNLELANITAKPIDGRVPTIIKHFPPYYFDYGRIVVCKFSFPFKSSLVYAYEEVEIVMPVKDAFINATPEIGQAYSDKFRFRVTGWHSSNVYLFRFGHYEKYNSSNESDKIYKSMWSAQNWIEDVQFFIEHGDGPENRLKVFYEIMDYEGFVTTVTADIIIKPFSGNNDIKILKKLYNLTFYLQHDQLQCAEYILDIIPLLNLNVLATSNSIQENLALYLGKFRKQGFIPLLVTKAIDVMTKFVNATNGQMSIYTLKNITLTLGYISAKLSTVRQEIDSTKMTKQLISILNILLNNPGNLEIVLSETPSFIKAFLSVAGSNYDNQQGVFTGTQIKGLFQLESFLENSISFLIPNENLKSTYSNWNCQPSNPFNCTNVLVVQAQYDFNLYPNGSFGEDWRPVTDVYELGLYNPVTLKELQTDGGIDNFYDISLPLRDFSLNNMSNVQCQVWNPLTKMFDPKLCYYFAYLVNRSALCRCRTLGKIAALYQEGDFPTTESPNLDEDLVFLFYLHMDFDPYCSTKTKHKSTTNKFTYQVQQYLIAKGKAVWPKLKLDLHRSRLFNVQCIEGGLGISIINVTIKDKIGELRNWFIKEELEKMIFEQTFEMEMKQGGNIHIYDPNQTTAKPIPTIPPIEEIRTNWIPIIAAFSVFAFSFLVCAFGIYFYQTRLLERKIFTDINSDKPKELTEEEKEKRANKKLKLARLNAMHMEGFVVEEKFKTDKKIRPISDANATILADSYFFRESAMLDGSALRFALDDSDNEDVTSSKTTLSTVAGENISSNVQSENSVTAGSEREKDFEENLTSINDSFHGSAKSLIAVDNEVESASDSPPDFNNPSPAIDIPPDLNNLLCTSDIPPDLNNLLCTSDSPPDFNNSSRASDSSQGFNNLSFENELIPKDTNEEVNDDNFAYV